MTCPLRLRALPASLWLLVLVTTSCAPLAVAPAVAEVSSRHIAGTPPEHSPDPPPVRPTASSPPPARGALLYPYNLPSYGNDLAAELARSAKSQDDSSRSP